MNEDMNAEEGKWRCVFHISIKRSSIRFHVSGFLSTDVDLSYVTSPIIPLVAPLTFLKRIHGSKLVGVIWSFFSVCSLV